MIDEILETDLKYIFNYYTLEYKFYVKKDQVTRAFSVMFTDIIYWNYPNECKAWLPDQDPQWVYYKKWIPCSSLKKCFDHL